MNLLKKIRNKFLWFIEDIIWFVYKPYYKNKIPISGITIGVTTFMDRYHNCLRPLLNKVAILFPENEIIVVANGHVKQREQIDYLNKIKLYCEKFPNVKLISFVKPQGLSCIWNRIIESSINEKVLVLNDDLKMKCGFNIFLQDLILLNNKIKVINNSWSHFLIDKEIFIEIGPFDEGLLEIGGEDDDYAARMALKGIEIEMVHTNTISGKLKTKNKMLKVNSYGRNMFEEKSGYSSNNSNYLSAKWDMRNEYFEGATKVNDRSFQYWKLRK